MSTHTPPPTITPPHPPHPLAPPNIGGLGTFLTPCQQGQIKDTYWLAFPTPPHVFVTPCILKKKKKKKKSHLTVQLVYDTIREYLPPPPPPQKKKSHLTIQLVYDTIREYLAPGVTNRGVYTYVREIGRAINVN